MTIAPVEVAAESDVMDQRLAVTGSSDAGVGTDVADGIGLWDVRRSGSTASVGDTVFIADVGTGAYVDSIVRVGLLASERPCDGVGTVGAGIVLSNGTPSGSVEVGGNDAGNSVEASPDTAQLALQRPVQRILQRPVQLTLQRSVQLTLRRPIQLNPQQPAHLTLQQHNSSGDGISAEGSSCIVFVGTPSEGVGVDSSTIGDGVDTNVSKLGSIDECERCWAWLCGVVCLWVCVLMSHWYESLLQSV